MSQTASPSRTKLSGSRSKWQKVAADAGPATASTAAMSSRPSLTTGRRSTSAGAQPDAPAADSSGGGGHACSFRTVAATSGSSGSPSVVHAAESCADVSVRPGRNSQTSASASL
eukprot:5133450-Prymnesium_polylepis.2